MLKNNDTTFLNGKVKITKIGSVILITAMLLLGGFLFAETAEAADDLEMTSDAMDVYAPVDSLPTSPTPESKPSELENRPSFTSTLSSENGLASTTQVRIKVEVTNGTASDMQLWAKDTNDDWYDVTVTGWGDSDGFSIPAGYEESTDFYAIGKTGTYTIKTSVVDVGTDNTLLSETDTVSFGIQSAISNSDVSDTIEVSDGTYNLETSTLNVNEEVAIVGESESGVIIDASAIDGYGISVPNGVNNVTLKNFTLIGPSAGYDSASPEWSDFKDNYGLKISHVDNINLENLTVEGSGISEVDLNNVTSSTLTNVTAIGNETPGVGVALSGSSNIILDGVETETNSWGGVGLFDYQKTSTEDITIMANNILNEDVPVYVDDENNYEGTVKNIILPARFTHAVENTSFRDRADDFIYYQKGEANAIAYALTIQDSSNEGVDSDNSDSYVRELSTNENGYTTQTDIYVVGDGMSIQAAIDNAKDGADINVADGTFNESLLIEKSLTINGADEKSIITGDDSENNYIIKIDGTNDVVINNLEINGQGETKDDNAFEYGILLNNSGTESNPIEIYNLTVKNIWKTNGNGIEIDYGSYALIHDNVVSLFYKRGIRFIDSKGKIYDNEVIGDNVNGTDRVQNLVNIFDGSNVEIYNNNLHNALTNPEDTPTWDSPAIFVSSFAWDDSEADSYANIHNNEIYDSDSGIVVGSVYSDADESSVDILNNSLHDLNWAVNFEVNTVSATITENSFINNNIAVSAEGHESIDGPVIDAKYNYWGAASGPSGEGAGDGGAITAVNADYRPWLLEEDGTKYDQTIALTSSDNWSLVSAPKYLSEVPTIWNDGSSSANTDVSIVAHVDGQFNSPSGNNKWAQDMVKPVSGFFVKATNKAGIGFMYEQVEGQTTITKDMVNGWNLVGTNASGTPDSEFSTVRYDRDSNNEGVTTLNVPSTFNERKDMTGSWSSASDQDIDIDSWPSDNLYSLDGYWVFSNAIKTYSKISN